MNAAVVLLSALVASGPRILTNTAAITDIAATPARLWVATEGGLEHYDPATLERTRVYTTADGLADLRLLEVTPGRAGTTVAVRSVQHQCTLGPDDRFTCESARAVPSAVRAGDLFEGRRVRARAALGRRAFIGTEDGLFAVGQQTNRLTPAGQPCTNFAMAMVEHRGELWLGAFDGGLCVSADGETFASVPGPRMVNDLLSHPLGLFVASNEGLFRVDDDRSLTNIEGIEQRGVNSVAWDGRRILATTPGALWALQPRRDRAAALRWMPGDSHALQDVVVARDGTVWMASEDRGAIRMRHGEVRVFDRLAGLPSSWALRVGVDRRGVAYVATLRDGLVKIEGDTVSVPSDLSGAWMLEAHVSGDRVLLGTQGGAAEQLADGTLHSFAGLPNPNVHSFASFHGNLHVGTESGMAIYEGAG